MARSAFSPNRRSFLLGLASVALATTAGCNAKLHDHAGVLLAALGSGDLAAVLAVSGPQLRDELDAGMFAQVSAEYAMLGELEDRTRTGAGVRNGVWTIDYRLQFARGEVALHVVSVDEDLLDGFTLEGEGWKQAEKALRQERLAEVLGAIERRDDAAARALCHETVSNEDVEKVVAHFAPLGTAREATYVGGDAHRIEVTYDTATLVGKLRMRGGKIVTFGLGPS